MQRHPALGHTAYLQAALKKAASPFAHLCTSLTSQGHPRMAQVRETPAHSRHSVKLHLLLYRSFSCIPQPQALVLALCCPQVAPGKLPYLGLYVYVLPQQLSPPPFPGGMPEGPLGRYRGGRKETTPGKRVLGPPHVCLPGTHKGSQVPRHLPS